MVSLEQREVLRGGRVHPGRVVLERLVRLARQRLGQDVVDDLARLYRLLGHLGPIEAVEHGAAEHPRTRVVDERRGLAIGRDRHRGRHLTPVGLDDRRDAHALQPANLIRAVSPAVGRKLLHLVLVDERLALTGPDDTRGTGHGHVEGRSGRPGEALLGGGRACGDERRCGDGERRQGGADLHAVTSMWGLADDPYKSRPSPNLTRSDAFKRHANSLQGFGVIAAETHVSRERDFRVLYEDHGSAVRSYLARRVEPDHVDDLAANTFMIAWRRLPGEIDDPLPWLYAVARNEVRAHRRRLAGRHRLTEKLMAFTPRDAAVEPPNEPPVLGPAFARLTDKEREAMLLVAFEGLDHAEAGRVAGCTPETFTVRVSRARKKLRIALAGALVPLLVLAATALSPSKQDSLLERAFGDDGSVILYWRIHTADPGLAPFTEEVWMHIRPSGAIDRVRELHVAGPSKGYERVFEEPYGIDDPWHGDITYRERSADGRTRTLHGLAYSDNDLSVIVSILEKAARGHLDLPVGADGSVRVHRQTAANPSPAQVAITLWLDPKTGKPTRIQWGNAATNRWSRNEHVERFERLPDDA